MTAIHYANKELDPLLKAHPTDAAYDLRAAEEAALLPGDVAVVKTGVRLRLPRGMAAFVMPRSGLAAQYGVTVLNAPGLIDADYRGDVGVVLVNHGRLRYEILRGDRIAQLLFVEVADPSLIRISDEHFDEVTQNEVNDRGTGGFGSTGRA